MSGRVPVVTISLLRVAAGASSVRNWKSQVPGSGSWSALKFPMGPWPLLSWRRPKTRREVLGLGLGGVLVSPPSKSFSQHDQKDQSQQKGSWWLSLAFDDFGLGESRRKPSPPRPDLKFFFVLFSEGK